MKRRENKGAVCLFAYVTVYDVRVCQYVADCMPMSVFLNLQVNSGRQMSF